MNQILYGLPFVIAGIFQLYEFVVFVYCIMTFIPRLYQSSFGQIVARLVEPFFNAIKKVIPTTFGMIDFSPLIALIILELVQKVIFWII
ncbi:YggT family protein [Companilactobacillus hulinensis]|uniref:YggT family protein n=1 Tax=Companilactobacillus hulinensis TaxID=2486007 RepID=UPI000F79EE89|nr:YggT family protein [Companilactobacillus hulinensis]